MYVRLTRFTIPADKIEEITNVYYKEIAPVIETQPGIVKVLLLEPTSGKDEFVSCTIWAQESDTKAFETSDSYSSVFGKIKAAASKAPAQEYFNLTSMK